MIEAICIIVFLDSGHEFKSTKFNRINLLVFEPLTTTPITRVNYFGGVMTSEERH